MKVWLDKKIIEEKEAKLPLLTHSLHYGSAVFEGIRFYNTDRGPAIFRLKDHINRLFYSASVIDLKFIVKKSEIMKAVSEVARINKLTDGYIRPIGYFGSKMGLDPKTATTHIAITAWPWGKYLNDKVKVKVSKIMRIHPKSLNVNAKISGHYTNSILATQEARKQGYDEALLLDYKGFISEGPGENIFFVKNSALYTPKEGNILSGITRKSVITIAKNLDINVIQKNIKPQEIKFFDEAFFTGTAAEITLISSINKKKFKEYKIGELIRDEYQNIVHGKNNKYKNWLTYV
ncbi:MAG: branched chain amino acid aminotransferase [Flavobacterium sp.]|nr:branched chain amino acid aminotransferase [Flavobacterium sp.]